MKDSLPWGPTSHSAAPDPWTPDMDLAIEDISDDRYGWVLYDPDNVSAYIAATEASWSDCPE